MEWPLLLLLTTVVGPALPLPMVHTVHIALGATGLGAMVIEVNGKPSTDFDAAGSGTYSSAQGTSSHLLSFLPLSLCSKKPFIFFRITH